MLPNNAYTSVTLGASNIKNLDQCMYGLPYCAYLNGFDNFKPVDCTLEINRLIRVVYRCNSKLRHISICPFENISII